jgi:hypothetical protein
MQSLTQFVTYKEYSFEMEDGDVLISCFQLMLCVYAEWFMICMYILIFRALRFMYNYIKLKNDMHNTKSEL